MQMSSQLPIITCYIFRHLYASSIFYKIFIIKEKTNNKRVAVMIIIKSWLNKLCVCGKKKLMCIKVIIKKNELIYDVKVMRV